MPRAPWGLGWAALAGATASGLLYSPSCSLPVSLGIFPDAAPTVPQGCIWCDQREALWTEPPGGCVLLHKAGCPALPPPSPERPQPLAHRVSSLWPLAVSNPAQVSRRGGRVPSQTSPGSPPMPLNCQHGSQEFFSKCVIEGKNV